MRKSKYPDFLVIGAGRSGTTWLYENLNKSIDIWLPPIKELHYFDRAHKYSSQSFLNDPSLFNRLFGVADHCIDFRKRVFRSLAAFAIRGQLSNFLWAIKYYLFKADNKWYASLFDKSINKITGDNTPAYQMLEKSDIAAIYNLIPEVKIIFILRNPIYRTWSQLRKKNQSKLGLKKIQKLLASDDMRLRNDYLNTINNYLTYFPKDNFLILYYDEIVENPGKLLNKVLLFLGVKPIDSKEIIKSKINSAPYSEIPHEILYLLIQNFESYIKKLADELPSIYTKRWSEENKKLKNTQ